MFYQKKAKKRGKKKSYDVRYSGSTRGRAWRSRSKKGKATAYRFFWGEGTRNRKEKKPYSDDFIRDEYGRIKGSYTVDGFFEPD